MKRIIKFILLKIWELGVVVFVPWLSFLIGNRWFGATPCWDSFSGKWLAGIGCLIMGSFIILMSALLVAGIIFLIKKNWEWAGRK